jgi:flagellar basal-body rod protein FlgB
VISALESNTRALLEAALNTTASRHMVVAHNIANVNTPDFRPLDVNFHRHMQRAAQALLNDPRNKANAANLQPMLEAVEPDALGSTSVSLESEVAKLSEITLQQQALLKALNRHFSILGAAISSEGRK